MTHEQFCYWLQGFTEIQSCTPTDDQWNKIVDHLKLTFEKVTPDYSILKVNDGVTTLPTYGDLATRITC